MTAPIVTHFDRAPSSVASNGGRERDGDAALMRHYGSETPGQLWERLAERRES